MSPFLFWPFTILMLGFGLAVVLNRNPVASALSLVVCFLCLAGLFIGLDAYFIGIIQVLVYAGAVMVLFLFIIMLLDLKAEERRRFKLVPLVGGSLVSGAFLFYLVGVLDKFTPGKQAFPVLTNSRIDDVQQVGTALFTQHHIPFQVIGMLVLAATIGVVVLSKRDLK